MAEYVTTAEQVIRRLHAVLQTDVQRRFRDIPESHYVLEIDRAQHRFPSVWTRLATLTDEGAGGGHDVETLELLTTVTMMDPTRPDLVKEQLSDYAEAVRDVLEANPRLSTGSAEPKALARVHYAVRGDYRLSTERAPLGGHPSLVASVEINIRAQVVRSQEE